MLAYKIYLSQIEQFMAFGGAAVGAQQYQIMSDTRLVSIIDTARSKAAAQGIALTQALVIHEIIVDCLHTYLTLTIGGFFGSHTEKARELLNIRERSLTLEDLTAYQQQRTEAGLPIARDGFFYTEVLSPWLNPTTRLMERINRVVPREPPRFAAPVRAALAEAAIAAINNQANQYRAAAAA